MRHKRIVDFSKAQQNGVGMAYMEVFGKLNPLEALQKLKGCREHFQQSVTWIKRNRAVIMADKEVSFSFILLHVFCDQVAS
jgi:hypothetical protein